MPITLRFLLLLLSCPLAATVGGSSADAAAAVVPLAPALPVTTSASSCAEDAVPAVVRAGLAIRVATQEEMDRFLVPARTSEALAAARLRLAPLEIDADSPRFVGTTIGQFGVYYPIRGAVDGVLSQYSIWFDVSSEQVVAEADIVQQADGVHVRLVSGGRVAFDGPLPGAGLEDGDFWDCFRWCVGAVLEDDVYYFVRGICSIACERWPMQVCQLCIVGLGVLEAGMISGCTYTCYNR